MKGLKTLIRLEKNRLDALRKDLVTLENEKEQFELLSEQLLASLHAELAAAEGMTEMRGFFGDFSARIKRQRQQIAQHVAMLERKMSVIREQMSEVFSEMKKYEIALENHLMREKERLAAREQQQMDEVAVQRFHRARSEERP
ncbi:MAG: flagellar FliJ family protein [Rickettsiales bacterium]|nr:flagellar FliJ family protein [Rickettsiales bacterium]